jgi:hypothetical protein
VADKVIYYAVIGVGRTISEPSGLVRRRETPQGPIDESLARDMSWKFTDAVYQNERGENFGPDLAEVSEEEAGLIVERFREKWGASL